MPNTGPLPDHHRQWFEQMKAAALNGDLGLMSCLDADTKEPRSVIVLGNRHDDGSVTFIPVGHLSPSDNPFEAYIPPN